MPIPSHRPLGAEAFEDRVLPSGVFPDFRTALSGPPRPPGGDFDHHGPDRPTGFSPDGAFRFGPRPEPGGFRDEVVVLAAWTPPAASPSHGSSLQTGPIVTANDTVEEVARPVVATPAGLSVTLPVRFVSPAEARPLLGPDLLVPPGPAANPARPSDLPTTPAATVTPGLPATGVPPASGGAGPAAGTVVEPAVSAAKPTAPRPTGVPEVEAAVPIEVDVPGGAPLAGLLGLDTAAMEGQVRQLLDRVSDLAADLPEGLADPAGWSWLAAAAALTGGAGYALWSNRSRPRTGLAAVGPDSVLVRWGEEHDARVR